MNSTAFSPPRKKLKRSGTIRRVSADLSLGSFCKHHGVKLEEGVVLKRLHAGGGVEIGFGDALEEALGDAVGAGITIVRGIVEQAAAAIEQGEVNAPGVNGDSGGRRPGKRARNLMRPV